MSSGDHAHVDFVELHVGFTMLSELNVLLSMQYCILHAASLGNHQI